MFGWLILTAIIAYALWTFIVTACLGCTSIKELRSYKKQRVLRKADFGGKKDLIFD